MSNTDGRTDMYARAVSRRRFLKTAACLILSALLSAVAASGSPITGAAAMLMLGLGQGAVLVAAGTFGGSLMILSRLSGFRKAVEITLGLALLVTAVYFTWRALILL